MIESLATTKQMYESFLRMIKKENTSEVSPSAWNKLINESMIIWMKSKLPSLEFTQVQIDDLLPVKVVTDGVIQPVLLSQGDNLFNLSTSSGIGSTYYLPNYYFHGLRVMARTAQESLGSQTWTPAYLLRSDKRHIIEDNPYRKSTSDNLMFEYIDGKIRIISDDTYNEMCLEYLRYPREVFFDEVAPTVIDNTNDLHAPGKGCVECEFGFYQRYDIVSLSARKYLGKEGDEKYDIRIKEQVIDTIE